jgi:hypothetical protein
MISRTQFGVAPYVSATTPLSRLRGRWVAPVAAAVLLTAMAISTAPASALAQSTKPTPGVIPPWATAYGRNYSQWSAAQWQWELEQPNVASSPVVDPDPGTASQPAAVDCTLGQSGKVWFLSGISFLQSYAAAYRTCSVPAGVALFFPVIDSWMDNLNCPGQPTFTLTGDQLRQIVQQQADSIVPGSMSVTSDGRAVQGLSDRSTAYRAAVGGFSYTLPANNALSQFCPGDPFPAGTTPPLPPGAYADGVYIMLAPLSAGVHHLSFTAAETGGPQGSVTQNVTYTITVTP